jgi:hypothetical protein
MKRRTFLFVFKDFHCLVYEGFFEYKSFFAISKHINPNALTTKALASMISTPLKNDERGLVLNSSSMHPMDDLYLGAYNESVWINVLT